MYTFGSLGYNISISMAELSKITIEIRGKAPFLFVLHLIIYVSNIVPLFSLFHKIGDGTSKKKSDDCCSGIQIFRL
jgi:hypothetical protein